MSSAARICMNGLCGATTTSQWKRGWPMKAGGFATLCCACGTAYDNVRYCERFHLNEPGWRECNSCDKPVHCGCVVSKYLHECLDLGGILCIKCLRAKAIQPIKQSIVNEIPNGFARFSATWQPSIFDKGKLTQLTREGLEKHQHTSSTSTIGLQFRQDEKTPSSSKDVGSSFLKPLTLPSIFPTQLPDNNKPNLGLKSTYEQSLGFALSSSISSILPTYNGAAVQEKVGLVKQEQKPRPKPSKSGVSVKSQPNKGGMGADNLVARPPAEGRGRGQLLPRYWPKITDQELLQISGDLNSNCTVTPLFEKVLSASDAGRIGRLVLPKACAEAYFPAIDQSEGLPIKIRDIKGKEWTFQFRFWPNNNSRMYVLEGVTPCIQNMQLQAGDTVIFSRLEPDDKLIIGFRKAPIYAESIAIPNTVNDGALISTGNENLSTNIEQEVIHEKKKARNIGSKSKRLHMHCEDAMELKFTWEEMQEFLRPPPSINPTVVMIENCELEEYNEPPVFGKKTIFTTNASRLQEQWVQCDSCSKWRKLPSDVLIPSKWTCSDNVSDPNRCSCSAPEERGDLNRILRFGKESKKRKVAENCGTQEPKVEPTGLDALATVAVLGANPNEACATTRHPRHRPGCSCIVCIQPPSGKGNHKPNCICNVCSTVRRRFKTLMLRKRKRLLEQESDQARKSAVPVNIGMESGEGIGIGIGTGTGIGTEVISESSNKGQELDLNCDPKEEEMMLAFTASASDIPTEWHDMLAKLVPKGTTDMKEEPIITTNKVIEGS
ncbi:unnamed protein product [Lactuca virosa]|uniref:Uncharacterized protein n=1 Tax=Lactuca virosa TaxID=75947 RepID=A0AAU9M1T2_9ASTR|nr:unnamed protein product [Lactuca virosa]